MEDGFHESTVERATCIQSRNDVPARIDEWAEARIATGRWVELDAAIDGWMDTEQRPAGPPADRGSIEFAFGDFDKQPLYPC
jgi:hypothetical protein